MALISIAGYTSQSRQTVASNYHPLAVELVTTSANVVIGAIRDASHLNCDLSFTRGETPLPNFDETMQQHREYCAYLRVLQASLQPDFDRRIFTTYEFSKDKLYPLAYGYDDDQKRIIELVGQYNHRVQTLHKVKDDMHRSDSEFGFGLVAPFIIALALALRMTKVTADLSNGRNPTAS